MTLLARSGRARARLLPRAMLALTLAGCHGGNAAGHGHPPTPVRVAPATRIDAPVTILASGVVEPVQTVAVTTQVSGSLIAVTFNEGDYVRAGQLLFRIDPRPLQTTVEQARANLVRDRAQAEAGARDDARYAELARLGYVAREQADQVHATALAQAATVRADQAVLRGALLNLDYATIRAPISGRSGSLLVRRGDVVSPGTGALVVINQIQPVRVRFPIMAQDFPALRQAVATHPLNVTAIPSDSSRATEFGRLTFLDNAVDSLTGTITGKAVFPNYATRLWPGELVMLTVDVNVLRGVLAVPTPAVQLGQQGNYVYVVDGRGSAQMRPITTGLSTADYTVVVSGLNAGEQVVVDGQSRLNPGARVLVIRGHAAGPPELGRAGGAASGAAMNGTPTVARAGPAGSAATGTPAGGFAAGAGAAGSGGAGGVGGAGGLPGSLPAALGATGGVVGAGGAGGGRAGGTTAGTATPVGPSTPAPSTAAAGVSAPATTLPAPAVAAPSPTAPPSTRAPTGVGGASTPPTGGGARTGTGASGAGAAGSGAQPAAGAPRAAGSPATGPSH